MSHPDEKEDRKLVKEMIKSDALKHARKDGGVVVTEKKPKMPHMTAGAVTGEGRLEKSHMKIKKNTKAGAISG